MALTWSANYTTLADSYGVGFTNVQYQQDGGTIQNNAAGIPGQNHAQLGNSLYCTLAPNETRREATPPNGVNTFGEGADVYFRFDFVLDTNYELNTSTWFHIISQIHSASGTASPVIEFDVRDGGLYIRGASETQTSVFNTRLVTLALSTKYSVIFRVKFSTTAANCLIQVWVNGTQVYNQVPTIAMMNGGGNSYWKGAGVYRSSSFDSTEGCWQSAHGFGTTYSDVAALATVGGGGVAGEFTDRTLQAFTSPTNSRSATYHIYAAGIDTTKPVGLMLQFHGDGAFEYNNPNSAYSLGGTEGIRAHALRHNLILVSCLSPDTTGDVTWWEAGALNATYIRDLVENEIYANYTIDKDRVWLNGYSGGAQFITQYLLPMYPSLATGGGAILFAGGGPPSDIPTTIVAPPSGMPAKFRMYWHTGGADDGTSASDGYDALDDAQRGSADYNSRGYTTSAHYPAGVGHQLDNQFGPITGMILDRYAPIDGDVTLPRRVSGYIVAGSNTGAATLTTATFTPAAGEVLVVKAIGAHSAIGIGAPTGGGLTWTTHANVTTANYCPARLATATVATSAAMSVSVPFSGGAYESTLMVERWSGGQLASTPATNATRTGTTTAAMTASVTATAGSVVTWLGGDWQPVTTSYPIFRGGSIESSRRRTAYANYWSAYQPVRTTGAQTIGTTQPTGQKWTMAGVELLPGTADEPGGTDPGVVASLVDTFSADTLSSDWTANGAAVVAKGLHVNAHHTNGVTTYSSAKTAGIYTFTNSQLLLEASAMPRAAGTSVNAQVWVQDPNPDATVARLGFEFVGEQNRLDFIGQAGANYAPIGSTANATYDPVAHRWLRLRHTGTAVAWDTSSDGLTWTTQRSLSDPPAWTTKTTLQVSIEAFRSSGTNDVFRVDNVNSPPSALATTTPSGVDALQRRTLSELDTWKAWLTTNNARGWLGEFNGVTVFGQYGDTTQQALWDALLEAYLTSADVKALSASVWASGREWGNGYPSGVHVGTAVGDPLTIAQEGASSIIAGHRTRGTGNDMRWRGVNLSGWEQGMTINGGGTVRSGAGYTHTTADFAFLAANGVDSIRLPLAWERVQPTLSSALDTTALTTLDGMLTAARQYGIRVVLDLHNYGRYTQANGTTVIALGGTLTNAQFSDFWTRMSTWVRADTARDQTVIGYDLMNEPHALTGGSATWETASQAVLTAIRNGGDNRLILVGGYTFSSLTEWATWHPDGWITDSANNFMYEAHHYWDTQSVDGSRSGTYQQTAAGGGKEILTYATELASATAGEGENTPTVTSAGSFAAFFGI